MMLIKCATIWPIIVSTHVSPVIIALMVFKYRESLVSTPSLSHCILGCKYRNSELKFRRDLSSNVDEVRLLLLISPLLNRTTVVAFLVAATFFVVGDFSDEVKHME